MRTFRPEFWPPPPPVGHASAEDLPSTNNRVTLNSDGVIKVYYERNNCAAYEKLKGKLKELFVRLGELDDDYNEVIWNGYDLDISGMSHQNGTLRFGTDPATSADQSRPSGRR